LCRSEPRSPPFAGLPALRCGPQPQRYVSRLHRLSHHPDEILAQGAQTSITHHQARHRKSADRQPQGRRDLLERQAEPARALQALYPQRVADAFIASRSNCGETSPDDGDDYGKPGDCAPARLEETPVREVEREEGEHQDNAGEPVQYGGEAIASAKGSEPGSVRSP
jgi:hypothetical protein